MSDSISSLALSKEIKSTEEILNKLKGKLQQQQRQQDGDDDDDDYELDDNFNNEGITTSSTSSSSGIMKQLSQLQTTTDTLAITKDYMDFIDRSTTKLLSNTIETTDDNKMMILLFFFIQNYVSILLHLCY